MKTVKLDAALSRMDAASKAELLASAKHHEETAEKMRKLRKLRQAREELELARKLRAAAEKS